MASTQTVTIDDLKDQIAKRISDYRLAQGDGRLGTLKISLRNGVARTFKAHWTGYRLMYPSPTIVLIASLNDESFWTEGYISTHQPSYVLAFRGKPHASRGTGAERPDDKFASPQAIEIAMEQKKARMQAEGEREEEIIRYEDFDTPFECIDQFFNYMVFYCLKAVGATWADFGYEADESIGWDEDEQAIASLPIDVAIEDGLKKSDILWLSVESRPAGRAIPCWFLYTKDKRLFVLSGEPEQTIPDAANLRDAHVALRRKGRDALLAEFDVSVKPITPEHRDEFEEIARLLLAKRQSVQGTIEKNIQRLVKEAVILELIPRN